MNYAICNLSIVPVRAKPVDSSEMVSELLFGEMMELEGIHKGWAKVKLVYDNYEGWVDVKQIFELSDETFNKLNAFPPKLTTNIVSIIKNVTDDYEFPIVIGSSLPYLVNDSFYIEESKYMYTADVSDSHKKAIVEDLITYGLLYLYTPYLWGGRSPFGIDCSGFTQMVFKLCGIKLLRDAAQQSEQGKQIDFLTEAGVGDLAFFDNDEGKVIHTGILIGKERIIHASGMVRIDTIDHQGIFNKTLNKYTHKLRIIKRFL